MTTQVTGSGVNFNGSTSGTILLTQPAVAGTNTITLPAETGTARTTVSSGTVLQVVNYQTGALATGTSTIPIDDTIPQNTEGDQVMSLAITPLSATSRIKVDVVLYGSTSTATAWVTAALFQDSVASALMAGTANSNFSGEICHVSFTHYQASVGTTLITFKVRAATTAGTLSFNGYLGGRIFGGVMGSSITITEVVP